jgi:hypothetical protein
VKSGDNVLIVGDDVGLKSVIVAKLIGPKGLLHVFAPMAASYNLIKKNMELNEVARNTKIYNLGASDRKFNATIEKLN